MILSTELTVRFEIVVISTALDINKVPSVTHLSNSTKEIRRRLKTFPSAV